VQQRPECHDTLAFPAVRDQLHGRNCHSSF
jgi:hypothetical protein